MHVPGIFLDLFFAPGNGSYLFVKAKFSDTTTDNQDGGSTWQSEGNSVGLAGTDLLALP